MEEKTLYECKECGKQAEYGSAGTEKPECCGKPMQVTEFCRKTDTAEHARGADDDDACDDGRAG